MFSLWARRSISSHFSGVFHERDSRTDFHSKLYRFIAGRVPDPDTAEDILQDIYLKIHAKMDGLRAEDQLGSWIYQITCNAIIDYYRRARPQDELSDSLVSPLDDEPDAVSQFASSVKGMLNCVSEEYREALELTELQGLSQVELATRLDISVSGAKSRVQRARDKHTFCCKKFITTKSW